MIEATGNIYSNQTVCFPLTPAQGNAYVVIFYNYDGNHIKSVPIKNRIKEELLRAYQLAYQYYWARYFEPKVHKLDNETSKLVEQFVAEQQAKIEYTPPDNHGQNSVEKCVQTGRIIQGRAL